MTRRGESPRGTWALGLVLAGMLAGWSSGTEATPTRTPQVPTPTASLAPVANGAVTQARVAVRTRAQIVEISPADGSVLRGHPHVDGWLMWPRQQAAAQPTAPS